MPASFYTFLILLESSRAMAIAWLDRFVYDSEPVPDMMLHGQ